MPTTPSVRCSPLRKPRRGQRCPSGSGTASNHTHLDSRGPASRPVAPQRATTGGPTTARSGDGNRPARVDFRHQNHGAATPRPCPATSAVSATTPTSRPAGRDVNGQQDLVSTSCWSTLLPRTPRPAPGWPAGVGRDHGIPSWRTQRWQATGGQARSRCGTQRPSPSPTPRALRSGDLAYVSVQNAASFAGGPAEGGSGPGTSCRRPSPCRRRRSLSPPLRIPVGAGRGPSALPRSYPPQPAGGIGGRRSVGGGDTRR